MYLILLFILYLFDLIDIFIINQSAAAGGLKFSVTQKKAWSRRISARSGRSTRG